mmetsp:Transcript_24951/g.36801  ORF Transcript_24951/g.36801 Transcript_24951/m.36801 type:complete len:534 (-) Transcript_24951:202-1803(-)
MESKRKQGFKKGLSAEDGRRRRGETAIQLRKQHREEGLAKRRNIMINNFVSEEQQAQNSEMAANMSESKYANLMANLQCQDIQKQTEAIRSFRKLLSIEVNPPVQECIDIGAVPLFVAYLQRTDNVELQFEAAWALTNIASTDRTQVVVDCGAIPHLVQQLVSPSADVREQCAWCLGNVAGDGAAFRDVILRCGGLEPLIQNIMMPANISLLRNCVWTLSNFCRGKPQPSLEVIQPAFEPLGAIIKNCSDQATIVDACWALSYLSDGCNDRVQKVVDLDVVGALVQMLTSGQTQAIVPALRTLGNIVSGEDHQTQAVVDANALPAVVPLLSHSKKNIRKESCWMLSNIAAGNKAQLNAVVVTPDLIEKVLIQLSSSAEWDVRKEAAWVISNIATGGSKSHVIKLIEHGSIAPLCELLDVGEVRILLVAMEALESMLKHGEAAGLNTLQMVDEAEGVDKLELLQEHENMDVYDRAVRIIEKYFGGEEEDESENLAPSSSSGQSFSFGLGSNVVSQPSKGGFDFSFSQNATSTFL